MPVQVTVKIFGNHGMNFRDGDPMPSLDSRLDTKTGSANVAIGKI